MNFFVAFVSLCFFWYLRPERKNDGSRDQSYQSSSDDATYHGEAGGGTIRSERK